VNWVIQIAKLKFTHVFSRESLKMNPRQRILAAIRHQPLDRFPTDMWATPEVWEKLYCHFNITGRSPADRMALYDRIGIDGIIGITPPYIGPTLPIINGIRYDEWGMGYRMQEYGSGAYDEQVVFPLQQANSPKELVAFSWPSADWYDYASLPALAAQYPERAIECGYTAIFYWHNRLRGLEQSLVDPLLHPDLTEYLLQRVSDFFSEYHARCFKALKGTMDLTQDFGGQFGLLINPKIFDRFYRSPIQRAINLAKSYNLLVFHHDDGDCRVLIPRLVKMGIDVLNPIQWRCGNWDLDGIKTEFGNRICFHSAVDNQQTLPFGTVEDVRREVRWLVQTLGRDRTGLILAPCHNLQPITPVENILALYDEARKA
jgi:uroporphyrinogen decarboxylase